MNKTILLLLAAIGYILCFTGCCTSVDCSSGAVFNFKIVDKTTGDDLVYDRGVAVEEFKLAPASKSDAVLIEKFDSDQSLITYLTDSALDYKLEYQVKVILLTFKIKTHDGQCCTEYNIESISSDTEIGHDADKRLFVVKI